MNGQIQMQPPAAQLAAALVVAQGAVEEASKDGRNPDDGYTYATADELVRVGKAALKAAGLALLPCSSDIVAGQGGGADLMRGFLLLHSSGASMPITLRWPVPSDKARDKAAASAYTSSLGYVMRDLLAIPRVMAGEEPMDSRRERRSEPSPSVDESEAPPEMLPKARANTRLWTLAEVLAEVARGDREHEEVAGTDLVLIEGEWVLRARWSKAAEHVQQRHGSTTWAAWRTGEAHPEAFSRRRWVRVWSAWPDGFDFPGFVCARHIDRGSCECPTVESRMPSTEPDTRPMSEVLGEGLPDLAPAPDLKVHQKGGAAAPADDSTAKATGTGCLGPAAAATPGSPEVPGAAPSPAAGAETSEANGPASTAPAAPTRDAACREDGCGNERLGPWTYCREHAFTDGDSEPTAVSTTNGTGVPLCRECRFNPVDVEGVTCEPCVEADLPIGDEDPDEDDPTPEDLAGDAGDVDAMEAIEAQERRRRAPQRVTQMKHVGPGPDIDPDDPRILRQPNAAALVRTEEAAQKVADRDTKPAKSNGAAIEMTYADGSVATIPVPPAAAKRLEIRLESGDSAEALKHRAAKWGHRKKRTAKHKDAAERLEGCDDDPWMCAECGSEVCGGEEYRDGVSGKYEDGRRLSPRGQPIGKAHESCVVLMAEGRDPREVTT